jgi:alkylation response protein AidB-like acyl-CoA dehydrogenase
MNRGGAIRMARRSKMDPEMFSMVLDTLNKIEKEKLSLETKLEMDRLGEFPAQLIQFMLGPEVALHLIFIPEEFGGLGAGAREIAVISERIAKMDLAVATSFLAICLGMDPIMVGATPEQKDKWVRKVADEGLVVAYGVTEPEAGSNVQALKTRADRVVDELGRLIGYKLNGQKQFITNGGVASLYTILADTPGGPSFFVMEAGTQGLFPGKHEDKHGIRASDTCPLSLDDVFVPVESLIGGVEGQGLKQANQVFGYTRLMVATFGLGGGMAALDRTIAYAKERIQFGSPLVEKQGYMHRLIVPNAVQLEAARAYIEKVAYRLDSGEIDLQVEGSIAKYFATEAGDATANDAIQALGGYGYIRDFEVEKIKRDIKITTIFEGTSEIQRSIISTFRLRETVRSKGRFYLGMAEDLEKLPAECGAPLLAHCLKVLNEITGNTRKLKLTRLQHIMFLLADMMTWCEVGEALCHKAANYAGREHSRDFMAVAARLFAREAAEKVFVNGTKIACGCEDRMDEMVPRLRELDFGVASRDYLKDMDLAAAELVK